MAEQLSKPSDNDPRPHGQGWAGILFATALALLSCSRKPQEEGNEAALRQQCLITAGAISGGEVELLRFGHFAPKAPLDCVVGATLPDVVQSGDGLLASRVLILRRQGPNWRIALDAAKRVANPEGYVGVDSIDDAYDFKGLRALVHDKSPAGQPGITLWLTYLDEDGEDEGEAKQFSLNPATGRYQEFDDRQGFKPEIKDPPHLRSK
jgi:hypothetical protein